MVSENVKKLKSLINDGYKIHSVALSVERVNKEDQIERVEIKLVHGKKEKILLVENDGEFTDFSLHFKQFEDGYGNSIFFYVEDLDAYNKEIEKRSKIGKPPKNDYEISIGSRKLIEPFLNCLIKPGPDIPLGKVNFIIKISKNDHFKNLDFRDQTVVKELDSGDVVFDGHIYKVLYGDDTAMFICRGGPISLHIQKLYIEFINFQGVEKLNFLSESAGIEATFDSDPKPNFKKRRFTIICPVLNLKIPNTFSIDDVTFYYSEQNDDKIIENSDTGKSNVKWNIKNVRAKTVVEAISFFKAIQVGYNKISRIVDWIRLRVDISFPYYQSKGGLNPLSFNFQKQYSRFELTTQIYCRENNTNSACIYDLNVLIGHPLVFQYDPDEYFAGLHKKFKHILSKSSQEMSKKESCIVSSLHWLSLAIKSNNPLDKLLYLWTALEFIVSESKTEKKFNKVDRKAIIRKMKELNLDNEQLKIIKAKIDQLNDPPLMIKVWNELDKNNIELGDEEDEVLTKLRKLRNSVIHGKAIEEISDEEISDEDIGKFISIIEKLIVFTV